MASPGGGVGQVATSLCSISEAAAKKHSRDGTADSRQPTEKELEILSMGMREHFLLSKILMLIGKTPCKGREHSQLVR